MARSNKTIVHNAKTGKRRVYDPGPGRTITHDAKGKRSKARISTAKKVNTRGAAKVRAKNAGVKRYKK